MMSLEEIRRKYTPEMALTILIFRVYFKRLAGNEIGQYISLNKIDWSLFEQIIAGHQVRPVVYKVLSVNSSGIPAPVLAQLRQNCLKIASGNLRNVEELVRLHKLLKVHGIPNVPYKGVILSQFLFNDYISRETTDIDFMIDRKYFPQAHKLLIDDGYNPRFYNPDFEQQFLNTSHEILYRKAGTSEQFKIELHWAATSKMMHIPLPNDYLFTSLQTIKLSGEDTDIFNLENHLLVLLVHHGVNDVWRSLRHCLDVAVFLEKFSSQIDWNRFQKATRKYKVHHTTQIGFLIARQLFGTEIPGIYNTDNRLPEGILNNILRFPALKKRKLNFENLSQQLFLRDSFTDKLALLGCYIAAGITPNVRDMEAYRLPKNRYLLYYFVKPYRLLFKKK